MPKEFDVIDLLSKLSTNSFLIQTQNERNLVIPGIFLGLPNKFFAYVDVLDAVMRNLYVNGKGDTVVSLEDLQQTLQPLDMNEYFVKLESTIKDKDILGINENEQKKTPVSDVKVVENKELPQPQTPSMGELEPKESEEEKQEDSEETQQKTQKQTIQQTTQKQSYTKKQNIGYKNYGYKSGYKNGYKKTSANGNSTAKGKTYNWYKKNYSKSYNKSYKKSEDK